MYAVPLFPYADIKCKSFQYTQPKTFPGSSILNAATEAQ